MKQLSRVLTLLFLLFHVNSKAQSDIQQDRRVDPLLKQVDAKRPGLTMFSRKDDGSKYVNMAVLVDSTRMLTWFTCHGQAFDVVRLPDDVYSKIKSGDLNPFNYYKDYFFDLLSHIRTATVQFRQKGTAALNDTGNIYHRVYTYPPVQQARSTLQKVVAMERLMSDLCLQRSLFDSRTPHQLSPNDSFQRRFQLAGKMIREGDTTTYYNANPLSSASRIVLSKQAPGKMFVYDQQGQLADSVPLKAGKYAALLNEKEDVFLLYRGWLELQSQQAIAGKEEVTRLLNREHTMLYKPVYWEQNKEHLQHALLEVQEQVDAIGSKVMGLIVSPQEETAQLLATVYRDKPAEISYAGRLGFMYSIVYIRGHKRYELTDQRGNVMAVVSDRKKVVDENGDGQVEYYNADVVSAVDYFPFGSQMPGRSYSGEDKYRYGYNGKENDNEVKGEGNQQDYGMRIYDPRIARFLSVDPIAKEYPELTPYQFASNTPVWAVDLDGLEGVIGMPTPTTVKSLNVSAEYVRTKVKEHHETGMGNVAIAEQARQNAIKQGRLNGDGINLYVKSLLYLSPWWNTAAPFSDANDGAVLLNGKNLDGTQATLGDYTAAGIGVFLPMISGSALKKGGSALIEGTIGVFKNGKEVRELAYKIGKYGHKGTKEYNSVIKAIQTGGNTVANSKDEALMFLKEAFPGIVDETGKNTGKFGYRIDDVVEQTGEGLKQGHPGTHIDYYDKTKGVYGSIVIEEATKIK